MISETTKRIKRLQMAMISYLIGLFGCFKSSEVNVSTPSANKEQSSENESEDWGSVIENEESDCEDWDVVK